jgi:hypothetical protein
VLQMLVQSHYGLWQFPLRTSLSNPTGFTATTFQTQSAPRITIVTEGIEQLPLFKCQANCQNNTAGQTAELQLLITGTAWNGTPFTDTLAVPKRATVGTVNGWVTLDAEIGEALPMGVFTCQPQIRVTGGTAQWEITMSAVGSI